MPLPIAWALPCGRTECVPPRKPPLAPSPGLRRKAILPSDGPPAEGRAPHARKEALTLPPGDRPTTPPGVRIAPFDHVMPRLPYGLATRTRRPRPSEKSGLRAVPRFAPATPSPHRLAISRRGGLRTPVRDASVPPGDRPIRPPGVHMPPMIMLCPGLRPARIGGRTECVPPRKSPFAYLPGPSLARPS
jgi:hypothetical protein